MTTQFVSPYPLIMSEIASLWGQAYQTFVIMVTVISMQLNLQIRHGFVRFRYKKQSVRAQEKTMVLDKISASLKLDSLHYHEYNNKHAVNIAKPSWKKETMSTICFKCKVNTSLLYEYLVFFQPIHPPLTRSSQSRICHSILHHPASSFAPIIITTVT